MIKMPSAADRLLSRDQYAQWLHKSEEPFRGIIKVWHIAGFKPYSGSIANRIKAAAAKVEKKHFGVYFDVEAITPQEAKKRMALGERPDLFSFPFGMLPGNELSTLRGEYEVDTSSGMDMSVLKAVPYAVSCKTVLYYPSETNASEVLEKYGVADKNTAGNAGQDISYIGGSAQNDFSGNTENSFEAFRKGKADFCTADARETGNLTRALAAGKAEYFEILPVFTRTEFIQYFGIAAGCEEMKKQYIEELIHYLLNEKTQSSLCTLGLLPLNEKADIHFEQPFLTQAYDLLADFIRTLPNTFDSCRKSGI